MIQKHILEMNLNQLNKTNEKYKRKGVISEENIAYNQILF